MAMRCSIHKSAAGKRVFWILVVGLIVAAVISTSTASSRRKPRSISPPPPPEPMARMSAKRLQAHAADNAVLGGATAGQREVAALRQAEDANPHPPTIPVNAVVEDPPAAVVAAPPHEASTPGKPKPAIRIRARSENLYASKEKALADALIVARLRLAEQLGNLDPPVHTLPTIEQIKAEYLRPESVTEIQPPTDLKKELAARNLDTNGVFVEVDVEVSDDQVRQLRSVSRLEKTGVLAAGAFVLVLGLFGFLRLDAWTKGYLTTVIGVTIAAAVVGAMALLIVA